MIVAPSNEPDLKLLDRLAVAQSGCLALTALIGTVILCGWLFPIVGSALPPGWSLMKANTALAMLLGTVSIVLKQWKRSDYRHLESRACAIVVLILASAALIEHLGGRIFGIDTLLAADSAAQIPGRMSVQTATFLVFLGLLLMFERSHRNLSAYLLDSLAAVLGIITMVIFAGYLFDASGLFGQSQNVRVAPQTLVCMALLTIAAVIRRSRDGFFSVFFGVGIGSRIGRTILPFALVSPFLLFAGRGYVVAVGWLSVAYSAALAAAVSAILLFVLIALMAKQINDLERALRGLSITDELTKINNRRGFYLLGDHALLQSRRAKTPLTVTFFDINGLKKINDTLGHEVGSQLLLDFANLLRAIFRGSDIVARLGGDEFAVVVCDRQSIPIPALKRLDDATAATNHAGKQPYQISYSVGEATSEPDSNESFAELVNRADAAMYQHKLHKRLAREPAGTTQQRSAREETHP
ncbi:MAG: GGDEF domain-containing protein [Betaproteobacteria bacterium]